MNSMTPFGMNSMTPMGMNPLTINPILLMGMGMSNDMNNKFFYENKIKDLEEQLRQKDEENNNLKRRVTNDGIIYSTKFFSNESSNQ